MRTSLRLCLALCLLGVDVGRAASAADEAYEFYNEEAQVVTASRRAQSASEIPSAVDVITAEDIKASGAVNLWDVFRFRDGMDVLDGRSIDGDRGIVSVRGFPQEFAHNVLVLIDGRSVYTPFNDGVSWDQLAVQLQDIERIEIIRGPNTALYGTGAALGVINIITRKPQGATRARLDARAGNEGLIQTYQAVESSLGRLNWRLSHTYQEQDGFPALSGSDFSRKNVVNLRADWQAAPSLDLELFSGGTWQDSGIPDPTVIPQQSWEGDFQMVKLTWARTHGSALELTASRNDSMQSADPTFGAQNRDLRVTQHDAEGLYRFASAQDRAQTTFGAAYRDAFLQSRRIFGAQSPRLELYRGYVHETVKPLERLTLQGAASWETSNEEGGHPSYQAAAILAPVDEHALRASYSVSYTLQDMYPLHTQEQVAPAVALAGDPTMPPYKITSYELGYLGRLLDQRLSAKASAFYSQIDHFHGTSLQSIQLVPFLITQKFVAKDDAIARGVEGELDYRWAKDRSTFLNYTYERVTDIAGNTGLRTRNTPAHKINVGGKAGLGRGLTASAQLGYKSDYFIESEGRSVSADIPAYWRLDARLGWAPPGHENLELFVAGQNLLKDEHVEFADGVSVERTYGGGVSVRFGEGALR